MTTHTAITGSAVGDATIHARDLAVTLGGQPIFRSVSLVLRRGEMVGIVGPNGSGKTTLVRALAGLQSLTSGHVVLEGRSLESWHRRDLAMHLAYHPQGQPIQWPIAVRRVVELGRTPHIGRWRGPTPQDDLAIEEAIGRTEIGHLADRDCTTLSGGERARVMLARALAVKAPILMADEPVAALDPRHQIAIMQILHQAAVGGDCVVVVLHDLPLATRFCDRIVVVAEGGILADGPPDRALTTAVVRRAFGVWAIEGWHEGNRYVLPWSVDEHRGHAEEHEPS